MTSPSTVASSLSRNAALDAARGILMMLGVLLHTANVYSEAGGWLVWDEQRNIIFDHLLALIHVFRMPAFFWISGYFCALTFERNGASGLMRKRLPRLAIPLIVAWLSLNVGQDIILAIIDGKPFFSPVLEGVPLYHLWFLFDLLFYIGMAAMLLPWASQQAERIRFINDLPLPLLLVGCAALSMVFSVGARASGVAYDSLFGLTTLYRLANYAPYFIVGIIMYRQQPARQNLLGTPLLLLPIALPAALALTSLGQTANPLIREAALAGEFLAIWICIGASLRVFHILFKRNNRITFFLSDAAYTIYLFHHGMVVLLATAMLTMPINAAGKFTLVVSVTLVASALIHQGIIRRFPFIRFLYNGK